MNQSPTSLLRTGTAFLALSLLLLGSSARAAAPVLFEDQFTGGIPGWTAVQPPGSYIEGPMLWQYDASTGAFAEQSNIYTDGASVSPTRTAVMLINDTVAGGNFTYTARLTAGDDDAFGLIFGYQNQTTFYRVQFSRQNDPLRTTQWPFIGWNVDRMENGVATDLFGPFTVNANAQFINTQRRPFDVTIAVNNGLLTLTVVDDPLGTPTQYDLVTGGALPVSAAGKVGMFNWGMGNGGGQIRGFRIANVNLTPTPLAGNPGADVLANWDFLVTPDSAGQTGTTSSGGPMIWSQNLDVNGDRGTMMENSDWTANNTAAFTTNFPAPTAVAGDVTWSNYVYSARLISADDDGFGVLFRYQDDANFYRLAMRRQAGANGIKGGLTVQKAVGRVFEQVYANGSFLPPLYTPMDLHTFVNGNRLEVVAVIDPEGALPQVTYIGPIDFSGSTLGTGKIGVFSWAQWSTNSTTSKGMDSGTEVDSIKVSAVNGQALIVSSAYGTPTPGVGVNDLAAGAQVTASVEPTVNDGPGRRRVVTGWQGAGSVPATGTGNSVSFALTGMSMLQWKWATEYELSVSGTPGGTVTSAGSQYLAEGSAVTVTATPSAGHMFLGWDGWSASANPSVTVVMSRPITLVARFAADSDADAMPDEWETAFFGGLSALPGDDADNDGTSNLNEYLIGSNPVSAGVVSYTDGLVSRWINEARDRGVPGWFVVTNFGGGYRGVWDNSNQFRGASDGSYVGYPFVTLTNYATNASFQGPLILVRTNEWNPDWANRFSLSAEYTVGDDDGCCVYFRYLNESNWYRVTVAGQAQGTDTTRAIQGVSVQARTNGYFSDVPLTPVVENYSVYTDPVDYSAFKKIRITVSGTNDIFEVRVIGWDTRLGTPDWNPNFEKVVTFTDSANSGGRIGVGSWGMGEFASAPWNATNGMPVGSGVLIDNIVLKVDGTNAFVEDWETARLATEFPAGWENPYASEPPAGLGGDWNVTAHGTIANLENSFGTLHSGTLLAPKGDVEGPLLLAPAPATPNYTLEVGIHPLDDGAMGFVYDYVDTNNYARVLFDCQVPSAGQLPQGLNVARKANGVWSDVVVGDTNFVYTSGRPFEVRFANNNGVSTLLAWNSDAPGTIYRWQWQESPSGANHRYGLAVWNMPDGHFTYLRSGSLPVIAPEFRISGVTVSGGNVVLAISKAASAVYTVQRATNVAGPYNDVATGQTANEYSEPLTSGPAFYRLKLEQ